MKLKSLEKASCTIFLKRDDVMLPGLWALSRSAFHVDHQRGRGAGVAAAPPRPAQGH